MTYYYVIQDDPPLGQWVLLRDDTWCPAESVWSGDVPAGMSPVRLFWSRTRAERTARRLHARVESRPPQYECVTWYFCVTPVLALLLIASVASAQDHPARSPALKVSYTALVAAQALDVHSTYYALDRGGLEGNAVMRGLIGRPAAIVAAKAGSTALAIWVAERLRATGHPRAAVVTMYAISGGLGAIAAHNYRIP